jgi:integrase
MLDQGIAVRDFEQLVNEFSSALRENGKAPSTINAYRWGLASLIKYCRPIEGAIINGSSLDGWNNFVLKRMKPKTASLATIGVRQCFKWARANGWLETDRLVRLVPNPEWPRKAPPRTMPMGAMRRIDEYLQTAFRENPDDLRVLRNRALYHYIKSTAALPQEILQLQRNSFEEQIINKRRGAAKSLTPPPGVAQLVRDYLRARSDDDEHLWIGWYGDDFGNPHPLTDAGVLGIWRTLADQAGVPRFTSQQLRRSAAAVLVERGYGDRDIMEFLGVSDPRTMRVLRQAVGDRKAQVRAELDVAL